MSYLQRYPAVDTEHDDPEGLEGVYDEGKRRSIGLRHPVEHHHRDHHKMPRTGTIGRGDHNGQTDGGKDYQRLHHTELGREGETEESNIELQEISHPDTYSIQGE